MAGEPARLLDLADAVANGRAVDWIEAESSAGSEDDRVLIQQLRLLAGVADIHRADVEAGDGRSADPLIGTRWGTLEIRELIGSGSFGSVYRAHDVPLDREVALKLLRGTAPQGDEVLREGRLLAKIRHPHVVTVYGADRIDGRVGLWMEFVRGRTLEESLRQNGPLGAREAALIGSDLCGALAAVHRQGLIHRDVKAQNVMREDGGRIVLMDFGAGRELSARSGLAEVVGTPLYMAPEVLAGTAGTPQSDLYSLGVLLFRLVTGRYPVEGRTSAEVKAAHARGARSQLRELRPELAPWFVAAVNKCIASDPADRFQGPAQLEAALAGPARDSASIRKRIAVAVIATVALAVAGASVWSRFNSAPATSAAGTSATRSIGVRPLKNLTGDAAQDYFAAGLTDGLLAQLGAIKALKVRAVADAGGQAAVTPSGLYAWLEGSVQRSGGRVRVSARLVQVAGGDLLWGKSYDGSDAEVFMLQSQIAADVARDLNVSVTDTESRRLTRRYVANPQAQDAYLRGRYLLDQDERDALTRAQAEFQTAITLDPNYAHAYAGLAHTYIEMVTAGLLTPAQARALAPPAAERAVEKDPLLAEAVLARAEVRFRLDWDWAGAESDYRLAIDLNQSDLGARSRYVRFLAAQNQLEEAERQAREAMTIDPLAGEMHALVGMVLYYEGRYTEAIAHALERPGDRLVGNMGLARAYAGAKRFPEAIAELRALTASGTGDPAAIQSELAHTLAEAGQTVEARRILLQLTRQRAQQKDYIAPQDLAYIYVALGEHDTALDLLSTAIDERASRLLWLGVDPRVAPLRSDPRFAELLGRLGIDWAGHK